ncbi:hypothetical protein F0P96_00005 [Hymenobacter busanensis]|uniref:Uncharacterized protein n=2 Tax=Hymenobacter busanensis TaxID=2607656 RepID=A0A7L4ZUN4_9BACT|nr:hypothetical protein [Hymenobacter busanensis]KAA9339058.1 hypothetical protein F0P96_00005 [Hymenobacter busanensis]QHJ07179.1 hypothetical protein GUY19_07740 [Hymenobacter busanensis]
MKLWITVFALFLLTMQNAVGQSARTSVYKNLVTKKVFFESASKKPDGIGYSYFIDGKRVDKITYDSFQSNWRNLQSCCPCILQTYNSSGQLLNEGVRCTDAPVGWWKAYHPNGKLKESGQYKENDSGNWDNLCERGYCSVRVGRWTYFDEQGKQLYVEDWKDGAFVKQIPEQLRMEIWKVDFLLRGKEAEKIPLTLDEISQINILPKYKNKARSDITMKLRIEAIGYPQFRAECKLDEFKNIDAQKLLLASGIPMDKNPQFILEVFSGKENIDRAYLRITK